MSSAPDELVETMFALLVHHATDKVRAIEGGVEVVLVEKVDI